MTKKQSVTVVWGAAVQWTVPATGCHLVPPVVFDAEALHECNVLLPAVVHVHRNIPSGVVRYLACRRSTAAAQGVLENAYQPVAINQALRSLSALGNTARFRGLQAGFVCCVLCAAAFSRQCSLCLPFLLTVLQGLVLSHACTTLLAPGVCANLSHTEGVLPLAFQPPST